MDRSAFEGVLKSFYAARVAGEPDELGEMFAENAKFQIAGSPEYSMLATKVQGRDGIVSLFRTIADSFGLEDFAVQDMLIDGNKAAVRWTARVQNITAGDSFATELADFIEIENGKIISLNEFLDTALAG
ncbi:nuclear transport factor 2 family protein [Methyloceanibacter sp.]|uniref:nuclear transport factor 2 family protein n=1 Tax=Methyloceanibacter sp. TaxID=1965321 RepID=UPI002CB32D22|nr:nuclear transport factor 2 family protein [Methyloceanibacter sp.]HML92536.1 nuclear transport factor 2 family protein [Methyloceanibacter sp.]